MDDSSKKDIFFHVYPIHLYNFSPANEKTSRTLLTRSCKKKMAFVRMPWEFHVEPWKGNDPPNFHAFKHGSQSSAQPTSPESSDYQNMCCHWIIRRTSKVSSWNKTISSTCHSQVNEDWGQGSAVISQSVDIWEFKSCTCWWLVYFLICASPPGGFKTRISTLYFYSQSRKHGVKDCESIISLGNFLRIQALLNVFEIWNPRAHQAQGKLWFTAQTKIVHIAILIFNVNVPWCSLFWFGISRFT